MRARERNDRASIFVAALLIVLIGSISAAALVGYAYSLHRVNERAIAMERSIATAEAGLHQLIHYFWYPEDIPSNRGGHRVTIEAFIESDGESGIPGDMRFISEGIGLNESLIELDNSKVTFLGVQVAPDPLPADWPVGTEFLFRSQAEATTNNGAVVQRGADMYVRFETAPIMASPAAVITGGGVGANGQFNMHWGEAWAKGEIKLAVNRKLNPGPPDWDYLGGNNQVNASNDDWAAYRTASYIADVGGDILSNDATVHNVGDYCVAGSAADYQNILYQLEDAFTPAGDETLTQKIDTCIEQFSSVDSYNEWKSAAINRGTYFQEDAGGAIRDGNGSQLYITAAGQLSTSAAGNTPLSATLAMDYYRTLSSTFVCFFDTKDGQYPVDDGSKSNWADTRLTGSMANKTTALLYVAGDFYIGGSGVPPAVDCKDPDEGLESLNVFHDGVIYTAGDFEYAGNPVVYGSIVCGGNFECGGTPNIYYNAFLENTDPYNIAANTRILRTVLD
jgi:hypothetical protein